MHKERKEVILLWRAFPSGFWRVGVVGGLGIVYVPFECNSWSSWVVDAIWASRTLMRVLYRLTSSLQALTSFSTELEKPLLLSASTNS